MGTVSVTITWTKDEYHTTLHADFKTLTYTITYYDKETGSECTL